MNKSDTIYFIQNSIFLFNFQKYNFIQNLVDSNGCLCDYTCFLKMSFSIKQTSQLQLLRRKYQQLDVKSNIMTVLLEFSIVKLFEQKTINYIYQKPSNMLDNIFYCSANSTQSYHKLCQYQDNFCSSLYQYKWIIFSSRYNNILRSKKMQQTKYYGQVMLLENQNIHTSNNFPTQSHINDHEQVLSSRPSSGKGRSLNQSVQQNPKNPWTRSDELQLYRLHDKLGNKWSIIAHHMPGRTDNCVKNHFYSKLRKALRKLNKAIHDCYRKEYKEIKMNAFYKIIEANQEKHRSRAEEYLQGQNYHNGFKNRLLCFADQFDENSIQTLEGRQIAKKMIDQVIDFNRNYKRQPKKKRKCSAHQCGLSSIYTKSKHLTAEDRISEDYDSQDIFNSGSKQEKNSFHMQMEPQIHFNFQVNNQILGGEQIGLKKLQSINENEQIFPNCIEQTSTKMQKQGQFGQEPEFYFEHLGSGYDKHQDNLFDQLIKQDENEIF